MNVILSRVFTAGTWGVHFRENEIELEQLPFTRDPVEKNVITIEGSGYYILEGTSLADVKLRQIALDPETHFSGSLTR
jgi:hypothetical protein